MISRSDLVDEDRLAELIAELAKACGKAPFPVSAPLGEGLEPVLNAIIERLGTERVDDEGAAEPIEWSPL